MSDNIIALLPEHVANQIAAGEVVQRPASVVKELLENAVDADATTIKLIIKDAGKSLIQVIDNGKGMSAADARMCFERHATSKIKTSDDLFALNTKGFRGEALSSIASVAQVELKTAQKENSTGQHIVIEGGKFISQEECQTPIGSTFIIKNLFFNIPARRNFLKNDTIEQKHIIEEFERIALAHTNIKFILISNGNEILNLANGSLIVRIKQLYGNYLQKDLIPVAESTNYLKIEGYVSTPPAAVKVRKEQFLFVNKRFIKSPFLNHAIYEAYKELIGFQSHPKYFIFLELDPKNIDINIHPTKTEIKFTDERTIYMLLLSVIKRALGKANAGPSIDFENESILLNDNSFSSEKTLTPPQVNYNPNYNPFSYSDTTSTNSNKKNWEKLFEGFKHDTEIQTPELEGKQTNIHSEDSELEELDVFQLGKKYLVTSINYNVFIIDQQRAHERIIYEYYFHSGVDTKIPTQQLLFPEQIEMSANDFQLVKNLLKEFKILGFDIEEFGKNSIVVNGAPAELKEFSIQSTIDGVLETYKLNTLDAKLEMHDNLCRAVAKNTCIKYGKQLQPEEMKMLVANLMKCQNPLYTANGKPVIMEVLNEEVEKFFKK
ncbi:MAG: DNA mismatch repair endonuclease MutL [Sphingobacteriaceae bacterium]|nr:DNA mismatch repair endonuclease MutL [Sphingobacteriaceae bacterium]